jgi:hypothetical protein
MPQCRATGGFPPSPGAACPLLVEAPELDARLLKLWDDHPRFIVVKHNPSFFAKIGYGLAELKAMVSELDARRAP